MEIINMRFSMNRGPLTADADFLTATYEAGRHVERFKKLKARVEEEKGGSGSGSGGKKDGRDSKNGSGKGRDGRESEEKDHQQSGKAVGGGQTEKSEKEKKGKKCDRCLREGHLRKDCFSRRDANGTDLTDEPPAKASEGFFAKKASATKKPVSSSKRKRDTDTGAREEPAPKQAKTSAANAEDTEMRDAPIWSTISEESDF
jgi:hypothetical protein